VAGGGQFVAAVDHRDGKGAVDGQVEWPAAMASAIWAGPRRVPDSSRGWLVAKSMPEGRIWRPSGSGGVPVILIAVASRVFLKQDHVGPGRQGRPGADADGLTRPDRAGERMARSAFAHDHGPGMSAWRRA
jgi:hypothetical protein